MISLLQYFVEKIHSKNLIECPNSQEFLDCLAIPRQLFFSDNNKWKLEDSNNLPLARHSNLIDAPFETSTRVDGAT